MRFAVVTFVLLGLILCAVAFGGAWGWVAVLYATVFVYAFDRLVPPDILPDGQEFPGSQLLLTVLGVAILCLVPLALAALGNDAQPLVDRLALFTAVSLAVGQVGHPVAHELIHAKRRWRVRLGRWVYRSFLFGHHASSHALVHHILCATDADPNSARKGEGFWRFVPKALFGSWWSGLRIENLRHGPLTHPYIRDALAHAYVLVIALIIGGSAGVAWLLAIAGYAQLQVLLSDYVQHYGLRRRIQDGGRPEPVGPMHSWNAPGVGSSALMLNAPRHSDHHANPAKAFPVLEMDVPRIPMLPYSLPMMATIALVPPLWKRIMDPRLNALERGAEVGDEGRPHDAMGSAVDSDPFPEAPHMAS